MILMNISTIYTLKKRFRELHYSVRFGKFPQNCQGYKNFPDLVCKMLNNEVIKVVLSM